MQVTSEITPGRINHKIKMSVFVAKFSHRTKNGKITKMMFFGHRNENETIVCLKLFIQKKGVMFGIKLTRMR